MMYRLGLLWAWLAAILILVAGCGNGGIGGDDLESGPGASSMAVSGIVHGGQKPVVGAQVFAEQAGSTGYGTGNKNLACTTTNSEGHFNFSSSSPVCAGTGLSASLSCPSTGSPDIYLLAIGGNPGAGTNTALVMSAALGKCASLPADFSVEVNEVTTVASAWVLSRFMNCGSAVTGCSNTSRNIGTSSTNLTGLANAMALAGNLADVETGLATVANGTGGGVLPPTNEVNSLADILQDCANSTGATSTVCKNLFTCVVPGSKPGAGNSAPCTLPTGAVAPSDTLTATLDIARNPVNNVPALFNLSSKTAAFTPTLSAAPNDWTVALTISGLFGSISALDNDLFIAIDAAGDAWVTNFALNSVQKISPTGRFLFGDGLTGGGLSAPAGVAIDASGNAWVAQARSVIKINPGGAFLSGANGFSGGGLDSYLPNIAIDAAGNAWVTNFNDGTVTELSPAGAFLSGLGGFDADGFFDEPWGIAISAAGNVYVANFAGRSVTELYAADGFLSGSVFFGGGLAGTRYMALDEAGNAWETNLGFAADAGVVTEINPTGNFLSGANGFSGNGINAPIGVAIDGAGNAWISDNNVIGATEISSAGKFLSGPNGFIIISPAISAGDQDSIAIDASGNVWVTDGNHSVYQIVGAATPVLTPASACLKLHTGHAVCLP